MNSTDKMTEFKDAVLLQERENLSKVEPLADKQMAAKIMKLYEEKCKDDH